MYNVLGNWVGLSKSLSCLVSGSHNSLLYGLTVPQYVN